VRVLLGREHLLLLVSEELGLVGGESGRVDVPLALLLLLWSPTAAAHSSWSPVLLLLRSRAERIAASSASRAVLRHLLLLLLLLVEGMGIAGHVLLTFVVGEPAELLSRHVQRIKKGIHVEILRTTTVTWTLAALGVGLVGRRHTLRLHGGRVEALVERVG
jgi:hypothetical protein